MRERVARAVGRILGFPREHWRGGLPAWWSFFVDWVLVSDVGYVVATQAADRASDPFLLQPALFIATRVPFYLLSLCLYSWGAVGAWRSLSASATIPRFVGHALILCGSAVLVHQAIVDHVRFASLRPILPFVRTFTAPPTARIEAASGGTIVTLSGPITVDTSESLLRLLDDHPGARTLQLTSRGGHAITGAKIADEVKRRRMDTHVVGSCESACTLILLAGRRRTADPDALIGFHAPGYGIGSTHIKPGMTFREYLGAAGLSKAFIDEAMRIPTASMWFPPRKTLLDEGILTEPDREL